MILLLGGTTDAREIAKELTKKDIPFVTTTVSEYGKYLAEQVSQNVICEVLDEEKLESFVSENKVSVLIDATHPFARNISENAMKVSKRTGIDYFRFERPSVPLLLDSSNVFFAADLKEAMKIALIEGNRVLLTTGSRGLMTFKELIEKKTVFARVLPEISSIEACEQAGIKTGNIIAMQGPFSDKFNQLIIREKNIDLLITKESGKAGGIMEKIASVSALDIKAIIIRKPKLVYPEVFENIGELIKKIVEVNYEESRIRN